ncbi:hypothetical protein JAAARDRAFT_57852 [Jaapia argillacea MUCL 33604]|uniref:Protein kinase domain-containing protein n=1 Tax=Jaapia argillacea MUCL 33604 TaxID=933084 RepID=A0A067PW05_9AGAM|nr:hypothetical protein JAAARDRAFT_57852 [Jaapia argillacea MUCL 33604]
MNANIHVGAVINIVPDPSIILTTPRGIPVLDYLQHRRPNVNYADLLEVVIQVAKGLVHCHDLGILHGRVRCSNVLVDEDGLIKLVDVASYLLHSDEGYDVGDVVFWTAPELLANRDGSVSPTSATDVYSLAMTILEIFTGAPPFSEFKPRATSFVFRMEWRPGMIPLLRKPPGIPLDLWNILQACWDWDAPLRPTASSVLRQLEALA